MKNIGTIEEEIKFTRFEILIILPFLFANIALSMKWMKEDSIILFTLAVFVVISCSFQLNDLKNKLHKLIKIRDRLEVVKK